MSLLRKQNSFTTEADVIDLNASLSTDVSLLLKLIRSQFKMDIAFVAEFKYGQRVFRFVEQADSLPKLMVNTGDPLDQTYCQKIVLNQLPEFIADTSKNPITRQMPVTQKLGIGCYFGTPIVLPSGRFYGTLCCFNREPSTSSEVINEPLMHVIAEFVGQLIAQQNQESLHDLDIRDSVLELIDADAVEPNFQPIYDAKRESIVGFEALSRFKTQFRKPVENWFLDAEKSGVGYQLQEHALKKALEAAKRLPEDCYVSVNISPEHLSQNGIKKLLQSFPGERLIIEITEHSAVQDYILLNSLLKELQSHGVRVAIDDVGSGYANLKHIIELEPDIIKLDSSLINGVSSDKKRLAIASAFNSLAKVDGSVLIAEGVETQCDYMALNDLNIPYIQGYIISQPVEINAIPTLPYHFG